MYAVNSQGSEDYDGAAGCRRSKSLSCQGVPLHLDRGYGMCVNGTHGSGSLLDLARAWLFVGVVGYLVGLKIC
jgi:hypothetical protein